MSAKIIIALSLSFLSFITFAQNSPEEILTEAESYYDKGQTRKALNLLNKYILIDSSNASAYYMRGNCFAEVNQIERSKSDYLEALALDSTLTNVFYNLGNTYEELEQLDSAEYYFRSFVNLDSADADGLVRLGNVLKYQGRPDSVLLLYEKAYQLDSSNLMTTYFLAQEYYALADFNKTIQLSISGKKIDSLDLNFYLFHGLSAINVGDFEEAMNQAKSALLIDSTNIDVILLAIESEILNKTSPSKIQQDSSFKYKFTGYRSANLDQIISKDSLASGDFESLIQRGEVLGLDKYYEHYINQKNQQGFSPYSTRGNEKVKKYWQEEDLSHLTDLTSEVLSTSPIYLDDLYKVAVAHYLTGRLEEFRKLYTLYFGLMESIIATGDGKSHETAYVVISTSDEYALLHYYGLGSQGQSLQHYGGHSFDILKSINEYDEQQEIYFLIDIPLGYLNSTFSKGSESKKKKKKKKKKGK